MRLLVINLDRRPDRWQLFQHRHKSLTIDIERIAGIDGQTLDFQPLIDAGFIPPHAPDRQYTRGSIGIALTFRQIWQQIAAGNQPALVLEDDVILSPDALDHARKLVPLVMRGQCDLVYLGYNFNTPIAFETMQGFKGLVKFGETILANSAFQQDFQQSPPPSDVPWPQLMVRIMHAWGMCAMLVSPAGAQKLLDECLPLPDESEQIILYGQDRTIPPIGIDSMVNLRLQQSRIKAFGLIPPPVITPNDSTDSDSLPRNNA